MAKGKNVHLAAESELLDDDAAAQEELKEPEQEPESPLLEPVPAEPAPAAAEPAQAKPDEAKVDQAIPYSRFEEVVKERNKLREDWARLDERRRQATEATEAAKRQADQLTLQSQRPDPTIDPVGANQWDLQQRIAQLEQLTSTQAQEFQRLQQTYGQDRQAQEFSQQTIAEAQAYTQQQPDYPDAARFLAKVRMDFWENVGYSPEQARQNVVFESQAAIAAARQAGKNWPDVLMNLAKQLGFQPHAANGAAAVQPTPAAASQAGKVLAQVAKGQSMQGLGRTSGAGNENSSRYATMTAAEVAAIPEAQWQRDWNNPQLKPIMQRRMRELDGFSADDDDVRYFNR
jgi:hypothetical protein